MFIHTERIHNKERARARTMMDNGGNKPLKCNVNDSTQYAITHLFPVPAAVPPSVNTP